MTNSVDGGELGPILNRGDALAESLAAVLASIGDHVVMYDAEWRYTFLNDKAAEMLGRSKAELLGRSIWDVFPEAVGNQYYRELHEARAGQKVIRSEHFYEPWGRWFENHIYPSGENVTVFSSDVTWRKQAECEIREAAERLQLALDAAQLGDWSWSAETDLVTLSPRAAEILGLPSEPRKTWPELRNHLWVEDREAARRAVDRAIAERTGYDIEYRVTLPDGSWLWVASHGQAQYGDSGAVIGWRGVVQDVTARKRVEEQLRRSETRYRKLVDESPYSVQIFAPDGRTLRVNAAFTRLWGITLERMSDYNLLTDPQLERLEIAPLLRRAVAGETVHIPVARYVPEFGDFAGQERSVRAVAYPLKNDHGVVEELVLVHEDITEQKLAEDALRDADRRKDNFLAILAHELRNPLAPIRNAVEVLKLIGPRDPVVLQARDMIERQSGQMAHLVDDLLDVSRISRGKVLLRKEPVDLVPLVTATAIDLQPGLENAGLRFSRQIANAPLWVQGDPTRLSQIVVNLLHNAAKFTDSGGHVSLGLSESADKSTAILWVRDTGIGIDAESLERLFEPFRQAERSVDRSRDGLGLGLALVKGLVELHSGTVTASSPGPGKGAEFVVRLPLVPAPVHTAPQSPAAVPGKRPLRVLVIEDNRDAADSLRMLLQIAGHEVKLAFTGLAGLEAARQFRPHVVLCDIGLPGGMDGYGVARALRNDRELFETTLVALTGYGQDEDQRKARQAGFDKHLVKPVDPNHLTRFLDTWGEGRPVR